MTSGTNDEQFACWKDGSTAANGGDCPMVNFAVAGMQQLLTTVRGAGAQNLVLLGGVGYASQLGLWPKFVAWSWSDGNSPQLLANMTTFDPGGIGPAYRQYLECIAGKTVMPATSCAFVPSTGCE